MQNITLHDIFQRGELLLGSLTFQKISNTKIILFGVGGVGSWCAESLIRNGIGHLTLVDFDTVNVSNINRQLMATTQTIGLPKAEVLKSRLKEINPFADIQVISEPYSPENRDLFHLENYDYIIDAIDSLKDKTDLLVQASKIKNATLFSSMGAALKVDPTRIRVAKFWDVQGDPLARAIRKRMKRNQTFPEKDFLCVFSDELLPNLGVCNEESQTLSNSPISKPHTNGSLSHITAIFGFTLAGLVVKKIHSQCMKK